MMIPKILPGVRADINKLHPVDKIDAKHPRSLCMTAAARARLWARGTARVRPSRRPCSGVPRRATFDDGRRSRRAMDGVCVCVTDLTYGVPSSDDAQGGGSGKGGGGGGGSAAHGRRARSSRALVRPFPGVRHSRGTFFVRGHSFNRRRPAPPDHEGPAVLEHKRHEEPRGQPGMAM